jgi:hypothetical protein
LFDFYLYVFFGFGQAVPEEEAQALLDGVVA